ncbi:DUF29 domain-containing protein [Beijerinckia sp. L45]|uniref:DUF29 domain-containing protein n=1 Tax=Beijerinckia sp. L45 TaxID=1641855 RepID=UPI00131CE963|nr:DUF29 domain-containing protein [Beijerinckia sp. L45]
MAKRSLAPAPDAATDLYETDFYAWTLRQAELLRSGDLSQADRANLAEEIETLGRSERAALRSAYRLVALHLLKLIAQPARASRSWLGTIARERAHAARVLADNPSLKPQRETLFHQAYQDARKEAVAETGLPLTSFPVDPAFELADLENDGFLPDAPAR